MKDIGKTSLCKLIKKEFHSSETEEFIGLIVNARFWCRDCGRSARKKKNLCNPVKLPIDKGKPDTV